jgi:hypothetical protein
VKPPRRRSERALASRREQLDADAPAGPRWGRTPREARGPQGRGRTTDGESARPNPVASSAEALRVGHGLWRNHCETCHGAKGKGDGPNARLHEARRGYAPRDLTDPQVQENLTDGDVQWRIARHPRGRRHRDAFVRRQDSVRHATLAARAVRAHSRAGRPAIAGPAPDHYSQLPSRRRQAESRASISSLWVL